jgi:hypothetical protein
MATRLATEMVEVGGVATKARRYVLRGSSFRIDLWYSHEGELVALEAPVSGGRVLRYLRDLEPVELDASATTDG